MEQEKKNRLIEYLVYFCIASLITLAVFAIKGFFTDRAAVNLQILAAFFATRVIVVEIILRAILRTSEAQSKWN